MMLNTIVLLLLLILVNFYKVGYFVNNYMGLRTFTLRVYDGKGSHTPAWNILIKKKPLRKSEQCCFKKDKDNTV